MSNAMSNTITQQNKNFVAMQECIATNNLQTAQGISCGRLTIGKFSRVIFHTPVSPMVEFVVICPEDNIALPPAARCEPIGEMFEGGEAVISWRPKPITYAPGRNVNIYKACYNLHARIGRSFTGTLERRIDALIITEYYAPWPA